MELSEIVAKAKEIVFDKLGTIYNVGGHQVEGIFLSEEVGTPAGILIAPVLVVRPSAAKLIAKGAHFHHEGLFYQIDHRHINEEGMMVLELIRA